MWAEGGGFLFKVGRNTGRPYRGEMTPGGSAPGRHTGDTAALRGSRHVLREEADLGCRHRGSLPAGRQDGWR